ncbi:hypothetical protein WAK64_01085 [Bacillus spongiae]|uniref:Stage VI sporulation protein D N-terminal domain-containing protein n=1 Tax=Bacillus spongiae TaxID=2683610 RepID=A0ABU8H8Z7_9BACI
MIQGQPSCLRFSLEESVWFKRGQEVEELRSISLDPHITLQEQEQYVLIRGHLELTGEYIGGDFNGDATDEDWSEEKKYGKLVSIVERNSQGECEFSHRFPVDITIPKNRITNLDSIDVFVDSFDYVVPENACLKITADLTISGIDSELPEEAMDITEEKVFEPLTRGVAVEDEVQIEMEDLEEEVEIKLENSPDNTVAQEGDYQPFYLEARQEKQQEQDEEVPVSVQFEQKDSPPVFHYEEQREE